MKKLNKQPFYVDYLKVKLIQDVAASDDNSPLSCKYSFHLYTVITPVSGIGYMRNIYVNSSNAYARSNLLNYSV